MENHSLDSESRSKADHDPPLSRGLFSFLVDSPAQLVQHKYHRRRHHVPVLPQNRPARRQLAGLQPESRVDVVQDPTAARVHRPKEVVPPHLAVAADADAEPERRESVEQTPFQVLRREGLQPGGDVPGDPARSEPHVEKVRRPGHQGLRGGHHLEERTLAAVSFGVGVGADDDRARAVAEHRLWDEGVEGVPLPGPTEAGEGELDAGHEDARAAVVLGEVLGQAQRGAPGRAAAELEHGAVDAGAEAQARGQPEVRARGAGLRAGAHHQVGDVGGWSAPPRDGRRGGRRGQLRSGLGDHVQPCVEVPVAVEEARVGVEHLLSVVKETSLQPGYPTYI